MLTEKDNNPNGKIMTNHKYRLRHSRTMREEPSVGQAKRNSTTDITSKAKPLCSLGSIQSLLCGQR